MSAVKSMTATVRAVARRKITATRAPLTLTPTAVSRIKGLMAEQPQTVGLRIGMKTKGCNGLAYILDYATEKSPKEEVVEQDGVKIFIDLKAQLHILGTEMDFVEDKLHSGFVFNNPNIKGTCGCGESFNV